MKYLLSEQEKKAVLVEASAKQKEDIQVIVNKILEKAAFMRKINVPVEFNKRDMTVNSEGLNFIANKSLDLDMKGQEPKQDQDIKERNILLSKEGSITSLDILQKEIWQSGVSSILVLLQYPIEVSKLKESVEKTYLQASRRCAGFKLISAMPKSNSNNLVSWFASALR